MPFKSKSQQRWMYANKPDIAELAKQAAIVAFVKTAQPVVGPGIGGVMGLPSADDLMTKVPYAPRNATTESPLTPGEEGRFADLRSHGLTKKRYKPHYKNVTRLARKTNPELNIRRIGYPQGLNPGIIKSPAYGVGQKRLHANRNAFKHLYGDFPL